MSEALITIWENLTSTKGGLEVKANWQTLFEQWGSPGPFLGQDDHKGWSAAVFEPCDRARANVKRATALCLDYDGTLDMSAAEALWGGTYGFLHTTRKHTDSVHRFRIVLPFSRPVSQFEFDAIWRRVQYHCGGKLDPSPKDPSRFWFTPGIPESGVYRSKVLEGTPMDPDEWLSKPEPVERKAPRQRSTWAPESNVERRAIAYISKMDPAISGSHGHDSAWSVALVLARGFGLSESTTLRLLTDYYNDRCVPPWTDRELRHKAKQAASANRVPMGFLLDDDREWDPKRHELPEQPPQEAEDTDPFEHQETVYDREPGDDTDEIENEANTPPALERYGFLSMLDLMRDVVAELNKPRPKDGAKTGHSELDVAIGGFRKGNVTIFGAKRGFGKTSYGNLVTDLALPGLKVAMFAGEDAAAMYGKRFLSMKADINAMLLRDYQCKASDWTNISEALKNAPTNPFFVRVEGRPVEWIADAIKEVGNEEGLDLVIVDYLQCIRPAKRAQDRRNEVTYVCKTLSDAIKGVNAAGLIFSQLKRTERIEPEIEDLKESGDIEDMADHILLGWKIEESGQVNTNDQSASKAIRKIKLAKNKDGIDAADIQPIIMKWNMRTASFTVSGNEYEYDFPEYDGYPDP